MKSYADAKRKINSNINKVLFVFMMPSWEIKWCISIKQTGFGAWRTGGSKQQTKKRLRDCAEWQSCQSRWMKWFHHVWSQQQERWFKDDNVKNRTRDMIRNKRSWTCAFFLLSHHPTPLNISFRKFPSQFRFQTSNNSQTQVFMILLHLQQVTSHTLIPRRTFACCDKLYYRDTLSKHIGAPASIGEWRMNWISYLCWVTIAYGFILSNNKCACVLDPIIDIFSEGLSFDHCSVIYQEAHICSSEFELETYILTIN